MCCLFVVRKVSNKSSDVFKFSRQMLCCLISRLHLDFRQQSFSCLHASRREPLKAILNICRQFRCVGPVYYVFDERWNQLSP